MEDVTRAPNVPLVSRVDINTRLTLGFALIVVLMLVGVGILLWQSQVMRTEANRLKEMDEQFIEVLRVHDVLVSFRTKYGELARARNLVRLQEEAPALRAQLNESLRNTQAVFSGVSSTNIVDPTVLPTLRAIQGPLPSQVDSLMALASAGDWEAVQSRERQVDSIDSLSAQLVDTVHEEVANKRREAANNIERAQIRTLYVLPSAAGITLIVAAVLGVVITRSITRPLRALVEGASALARGDFDHRVPLAGQDELAQLGDIFNNTTVKLRDLYRQLQSSETYLAEAQKLTHTGSWAWNVRTGGASWSREVSRIFGYDPQETGATWQQFLERLHPEDRSVVEQTAKMEAAQKDWVDSQIDFRIILPDGTIKHLHSVARPVRDGSGEITEVVGTVMDVTDQWNSTTELEKAFEEIKQRTEAARRSESELRDVVNTVPAHVWSTSPEGQVEFVNDRWLQFTGLALDDALGGKWESVVHPDDRTRVVDAWHTAIRNRQPMETEARVRRADGQYCWWFIRNVPLRDEIGELIRWYGTAIDIEDRKQAEQALQKSEERWRSVFENSAIGVALTDPDGGRFLASNHVYQRMLGYTEQELRALTFLDVTPEEYREANWALANELLEGKRHQYQMEKQYRRKDGSLIWASVNVSFVPGTDRVPRFFMALSEDITDRKRAEEALQRSEAYLAEGQRLAKTGSWAHNPNNDRAIYWSEEMQRIFGLAPQQSKVTNTEEFLQLVHPDDRDKLRERLDKAIREKADFVQDYRIVLPDSTVKHIHGTGHPVLDEAGNIVEYVGTDMDVTEQHEASAALQKAFEQIKVEQTELRRMMDAIATGVYVLRPDGTVLHANQTVLNYTGLTLEDLQREDLRAQVIHPSDVERLRGKRQEAFARGVPFEDEQRALGKDGKYRWFLVRYNPMRDDQGKIIRWYATGTDIDDRKQAEERMRDENLALREQIDQAFMFEEIVGSSAALQNVLSKVVKVAPTDSTVLITGETGTGKELVARAIHKHSRRSGEAFISVNCASIPSSLIASELFGHEKGAFTGAVQRRYGRFELAHSGTIFLDEIGELPSETQITLLRVLQERQFERVGGSRVLSSDVRVIAATNRDLTNAIASGQFRADLFYRLNVFPIELPPLRERKEDIPILVEYFVKRYSDKAGKQIRKIDKNTLELCQSYPWPGNIRELQNIVERSMILTSGDTFRIEHAWLTIQQPAQQELLGPLPETLQSQERGIIETALAESKGKVAGSEGAAAKLGIPPSTLESKIKQLRIRKRNFIPG